jgi:hypothetical protein
MERDIKEHENGCRSVTYDKNRRFTTEKGTREVSLIGTLPHDKADLRPEIETRQRRAVIEAYEERWGKLGYETYEVKHIHLTCQVMTILNVCPE